MPQGGAARPRVAVTGRGVWATGNLAALLDDCELVRPRRAAQWDGVQAVLAWGNKPSAQRAVREAARRSLPLWRIEDGFLRSVGLGGDEPPLSLVLDDCGIYYDARSPSRLESLVAQPLDAALLARAEQVRATWCRARVSKYNHLREDALAAPLPERFVLVIDQTAGDVSISAGLADAGSFARMLEAALSFAPDCSVLLKVHPDVLAGRKRGHYDLSELSRHPRIRVIGEAVHPVPLIEAAQAVFAVTSQVGFEALLHGKPVHVFGMPFYAGWGLTRDALPSPARRQPASLPALVHAALIAYPRYLDPESGKRCDVERLLDWMALQRQVPARFPAQVCAKNFSPWKRPVLRRFMAGSKLRFVDGGLLRRNQPVAGQYVAVWGRPGGDGRVAGAAGTLIVEDGFLRSVGLGADLVKPLSWVIDDVGIYYDATRPSRLELLLQSGEFESELLARAARLRESICAAGITKYNLGGKRWERPLHAATVILVPGQVESDASIAWGATQINTNLDLLKAVRRENPQAWILYKPHPDVVAGVRHRGAGENDASAYCNAVVTDAPMDALLDAVDSVHVLTSLTGFEALLRGKPVTCWGQPFYAGWGLTDDRAPIARRTRRLTLDELVAAALIGYPVYVSRRSGRYTTPETALVELQEWRKGRPQGLPYWSRIKRLFMQARRMLG